LRKLAIITSHPIQYNAPVFKLLAERKKLKIKIFYTWEDSHQGIYDKKFAKRITWDIPLLEGYDFKFVKNTSIDQGTHHYFGLKNPDLNHEIESWGAEAILIFGWSFHSHFKAMRYFKGKIPVYFRGDSTLLDEKPGIKTFLRRIWLKFVYHYIDFAFYVGTNNKNYYLKHGLKNQQLIFAPHAIDNERFYDMIDEYELKATEWKKELGISTENLVFLFAGKFEPIKNPTFYIKAANILHAKAYTFLIVGDGRLKNQLEMETDKNSQIIFLPFQNQSLMPVLYRMCHVFVLCSVSETWGLSVNEAMACSKPVLVSDKVGCAVDLVRNGENGFVFKSGDMDDYVAKIKLFNSENCIKFGNNSKKMIDNFSFEKLCISIENAINHYPA
jgi:glycosyltransferase involved in cell wall biosynthesis